MPAQTDLRPALAELDISWTIELDDLDKNQNMVSINRIVQLDAHTHDTLHLNCTSYRAVHNIWSMEMPRMAFATAVPYDESEVDKGLTFIGSALEFLTFAVRVRCCLHFCGITVNPPVPWRPPSTSRLVWAPTCFGSSLPIPLASCALVASSDKNLAPWLPSPPPSPACRSAAQLPPAADRPCQVRSCTCSVYR